MPTQEVWVAIIAIIPTTITALGVLWLHRQNTSQHGEGAARVQAVAETVHEVKADVMEVKADVRDLKDDLREIKRLVNPWEFHGQDPPLAEQAP